MIETQANYAIQNHIFAQNSHAKNKILGQMIQLGFFLYCYAVSNKPELTNKQKSKILYEEILKIKSILGKHYFKKYFLSFSIRVIMFFKCKLFPSFLNLVAIILNTGYLKATKKDGKRKNTG